MSFLSLTKADYGDEWKEDVDVWPDNWRAVMFFAALGTGSWNMGPGGPTGLRYEAFREVRLAQGIAQKEWPEIFDAVRVMEQAALEEMHKK